MAKLLTYSMKKILFVLLLMSSISIWGQDSKFSLGINAGIGTEPDNSLVWGLVARYKITKSFRIAPEFNMAFRKVDLAEDKWVNWIGNINIHYIFSYKNVSLYPIAGISFTNGKDIERSSSMSGLSMSTFNYSVNTLRLGGSFGGGIEYNFLDRFYINGEARYSILHRIWTENQYATIAYDEKNLRSFGLSAGIGYKF